MIFCQLKMIDLEQSNKSILMFLVTFDVEAKHKTVQKIETSGKQVFSKPRQLTPEKLKSFLICL